MHKNLLFINDNNKLVGFIITEISQRSITIETIATGGYLKNDS